MHEWRILAWWIIALSCCFNVLAGSQSKACTELSHTINLNNHTSEPHSRLTYTPFTTSLILVCSGDYYDNITWQTEGTFSAGIHLRYTEKGGDLVMNIMCGKLSKCSPIKLLCSGNRISDNVEQVIHISLYPECITADTTTALLRNPTTSESDMKQQKGQLKPIGGPMPYFGIILGFSICIGLAAISCLVVFLQKKLNARSLARHCGCMGHHHAGKRHTDMDMDKGRQMPAFMKIAQMRKGSSAASNQKMGTVYEL